MTTTSHRSSWAVLLLALSLSACGADGSTTSDGEDAVGGAAAACTPPEAGAEDEECRDVIAVPLTEDPSPADAAPTDPAAGGAASEGGAAEGGAAAGSCLEGSTGCDDTPLGGEGGVESGPDGSVPVGEAVAGGVQGPFLVSGYLVADAEGARLCDALAESFPPQCGGTSVPLQPAEVPEGAVTTTEGEVTWSDEPVLVEGELVDGVFVVRTA